MDLAGDSRDVVAVKRELMDLMVRFVEFRDVSPDLVGKIEQLLDSFEGQPWHDDVQTAVASYEPWGGQDPEHLYNASQLADLFRWALPQIEAAPTEP